MAIQTNISLTPQEKTYFQRFVNLSVNEEALPQGDATMRISPFDDYFLFTLYDEIDSEDTPIDLSNVGNIFINFIGTSDEINVKNHTQVEEVDLSQGQVLFKITKSDSKKVLALDNNNFYISTKMISEEDDSISDESILYQGTWLAFDTASRVTLTSQIEKQRLEYSIELAKLKRELDTANKANELLIQQTQQDDLAIQALTENNNRIIDEISALEESPRDKFAIKKTTNRLRELVQEQRTAQEFGRQAELLRQQNQALAIIDAGIATNTTFFKQAALNLQQYSL
tara:strand:+ start:2083 stop:2937 length:855 start_codon:yes stop_codon:yes gene_type:complete